VAKEVCQRLPACINNDEHKLVPIYVEYNPEDDELRSDADFGEGD
jgi:hypothetical protein